MSLCKTVNALEDTDVDGFNTLLLKWCYNFENFNRYSVVVEKCKRDRHALLVSFLCQLVNYVQMIAGRESCLFSRVMFV